MFCPSLKHLVFTQDHQQEATCSTTSIPSSSAPQELAAVQLPPCFCIKTHQIYNLTEECQAELVFGSTSYTLPTMNEISTSNPSILLLIKNKIWMLNHSHKVQHYQALLENSIFVNSTQNYSRKGRSNWDHIALQMKFCPKHCLISSTQEDTSENVWMKKYLENNSNLQHILIQYNDTQIDFIKGIKQQEQLQEFAFVNAIRGHVYDNSLLFALRNKPTLQKLYLKDLKGLCFEEFLKTIQENCISVIVEGCEFSSSSQMKLSSNGTVSLKELHITSSKLEIYNENLESKAENDEFYSFANLQVLIFRDSPSFDSWLFQLVFDHSHNDRPVFPQLRRFRFTEQVNHDSKRNMKLYSQILKTSLKLESFHIMDNSSRSILGSDNRMDYNIEYKKEMLNNVNLILLSIQTHPCIQQLKINSLWKFEHLFQKRISILQSREVKLLTMLLSCRNNNPTCSFSNSSLSLLSSSKKNKINNYFQKLPEDLFRILAEMMF